MTSKTKIGAILIGASAVLGTVGGMLTGAIELVTGIQALIVEVGAVLIAMGIRDFELFRGIAKKS